MDVFKFRSMTKYFTPVTFFFLAIILSFKMSFQGQYLHDYFLRSVVNDSIQVKSESSNVSLKGFTLSNSEIKLNETTIGTIDTIKITPQITKILTGKVNSLKATSGTIILNQTTIPAILNSTGLEFPFHKIKFDNVALNIFGTLFTLKSLKQGWSLQNAENESITLTYDGDKLNITSPIFAIPYATLANVSGTFSSQDGLILSGNIAPLQSQFKLSMKKEETIIDLSGSLSTHKIELGKITGAYNTEKESYSLKADFKEIPFTLFDSIVKTHIDLPLTFINSGLVGLNYKTAQGSSQHLTSFNLALTNLKARFFLYDLYGINGSISLAKNPGETPLNLSIDSIRRHKLNFENTVILMTDLPGHGLFPSVVTTEFAKGAIRLHDFKQTDRGIEATAEIEDLDINDAIASSSITSLAATGKLKGSARLLFTTEKVVILNAELKASSSKGKIHYFPKLEGLDDQKSSQAMENLDFTILNIDMTTPDINEPASIKIQIVGTNPILSNGYPLDFTIETQASLMDFYS